MTRELTIKYPALYDAASALSADSQKAYLNSIRAEYALLIIAAILSMNLSNERLYFVVYALVFVATLILLLWRTKAKPEQDWYKGRALAESIKTSTWCYCMRAAPFEDAPSVKMRLAEFRNFLNGIIEANKQIGHKLPPERADEDQVTKEMESLRAMTLEERRTFYLENRIKEQRKWYKNKAVYNVRASRFWVLGGGIVYILAILFVLLRIAYPEWRLWPIEPIIVLASSIIGWMQIKKFNELASAYTLTAFEIGIIQGKAQENMSEVEFANFVNEAERAFSREHTQWSARQD
jgi:hypothetical protein